jgi:hypothetical protein
LIAQGLELWAIVITCYAALALALDHFNKIFISNNIFDQITVPFLVSCYIPVQGLIKVEFF